MRYETFCIILIALIALTAFVGFSSSLVSDSVLGDFVPETEEKTPVKVVYLTNPNIDTVEPVGNAALTEPEPETETEAYTDYSGIAETEPAPSWAPDPNDVVLIAKTIFGEANVCGTTERAAVAWTILNRVDSPEFPDNIRDVVTTPGQFAFTWDAPVIPELYYLAEDVMLRWNAEQEGETDVGRILPAEYLYFWGDGRHNYFRIGERDQVYWDWSLESPYEKEN